MSLHYTQSHSKVYSRQCSASSLAVGLTAMKAQGFGADSGEVSYKGDQLPCWLLPSSLGAKDISRYKSSKPGSFVLAPYESFSITHLKKVCNGYNGRPLVGVRFVGANPMLLNICSRVPGQVPGPRGCQSVRCCFEAVGRCLADHSCITAQQLLPGMSISLRGSGGDFKLQIARPVADACTASWLLDQPLHLAPLTGSKENSAPNACNQR